MWSFISTGLALAICVQAQSSSTSGSSILPTITTTTTVFNPGTLTITSTTMTTVPPSTTSTTSSTPASTTSTSASVSTTLSTSILTTTSSSTTSAITSSSTSTTASTTTTSAGPIVTDTAYIDTILRHHNRHRSNHTASALTWNSSLADTAKKIASSCIYEHNTTVDSANYGQNIAAGFLANQMGSMVSDGFYNSEINNYVAYGMEPDYNGVNLWGHMTQIVWKATTSVGCWTQDCTATGLTYPQGGGANIPPHFTVCNYGPAGNVVPDFTPNIGSPLGFLTITSNYECSSVDNCVGPTT